MSGRVARALIIDQPDGHERLTALEHMAYAIDSTYGIGPSTGLPLQVSQDPLDVFYTTNEPLTSLEYLQDPISGPDVYEIDSLIRKINDEARFPRQRIPRDLCLKVMRQINSYLPPCSNEKRGREFKHKRVQIERTLKQKLNGKPKELLTSECIHCKENWSGLNHPLEEDPAFPEGMSLFRHRRHSTKAPKPSPTILARLSSNRT